MESISKKSYISITPLPLKSNSYASLPGGGIVPYACKSKSKSMMNVDHMIVYVFMSTLVTLLRHQLLAYFLPQSCLRASS